MSDNVANLDLYGPRLPCHQARLSVVLEGDESSHDYQTTMQHLQGCVDCQRKLDAIFVQTNVFQEVAATLRDSGEHEIEDYAQAEFAADATLTHDYFSTSAIASQASLHFLKPAVHPELLGRLGRYDIERVVGVGGTGIVLKAYDTELHRVVALKVLAAHLAHHASSRLRFAREARAAAAVLHPNVLPIYNVEADGVSPYLVMQYVAGESLQARVDRLGPLPVDEVLRIGKQTASALAAAHQQGLIHRDVKPANILLEDQTDRVVLSDFGLARTADDAALTRTGVVAGTPQYMSPEQASGDAFDHRSDLFSLGSVIYFMLAGRPPFRGNSAVSVLHRICKYPHESLKQIDQRIPLEVSQCVDVLLRKKPQHRYPTASEVADKLEWLLLKYQSGGLRLASRDQRWLALALCTVCLVLLTAGVSIWLRDSADTYDLVNDSLSSTSPTLSTAQGAIAEDVGAREVSPHESSFDPGTMIANVEVFADLAKEPRVEPWEPVIRLEPEKIWWLAKASLLDGSVESFEQTENELQRIEVESMVDQVTWLMLDAMRARPQ